MGDTVDTVRRQTLRYIGAREAWERWANVTVENARNEARLREVRELVEAAYNELLSTYFDEEASRGARAVWQDPPNVSLDSTEIVEVQVEGERAIVSTREMTMGEPASYEYHFIARGSTWMLTDRRWKDESADSWVLGVY